MAQLIVTCPECGLRGEVAQIDEEFDDPGGKCKHHLQPAKCAALRQPLLAANRMLDLMKWDSILADDVAVQDLPSPSIIPDADVHH
jgi:hypothetical protein